MSGGDMFDAAWCLVHRGQGRSALGMATLRHRQSAAALPETRDESADTYRAWARGARAAFCVTCAAAEQRVDC